MKIRLLNNGGFCSIRSIKFPVEVEARKFKHGFYVDASEMVRVGMDEAARDMPGEPQECYFSLHFGECELVTDNGKV